MTSLDQINSALSDIENEIARFEQSLASAKARKVQLEQTRRKALQEEEERRRQEQERQRLQQQRSQKSPSPGSPAQVYTDRIAELKRQIAEAEAEAQRAVQKPPLQEEEEEEVVEYVEEYEDGEEYTEVYEYYDEDGEYIGEGGAAANQAPASAAAVQNPAAVDYSSVRQQQLDTLKQKNQWEKPVWGTSNRNSSLAPGEVQTYEDHVTPSHTHLNDNMDALKKKHQWEKPAWATRLPSNESPVDKSTMQAIKSETQSGYSRHVKAKDTLARSNGTFVAPSKDVPPPRLCWIVVDINRKKAGKIVMHLHGQGTDQIVDRFQDLKGYTINKGGKNQPMSIEDFDNPKFYITTNQTTKGLDTKPDIYGLVQEGKEVIAAIKNAEELGGVTAIRQAHIYPVKKANS